MMQGFNNQPRRLGLNERQTEILGHIRDLINEKGFSPSFREIAERAGTEPSNISRYIHQLKKRGWIDFENRASRSITILEKEQSDEN